jgi:hypothetical protein
MRQQAFQEAIFIVKLEAAQQIHIQRLSPKNKGISFYIPLQAGYRSKKARFNSYIVACNSVGYFIPQCYVIFFMFRFFKFYLPAMPSPPPATLSEHSLAYFSFFFLPSSLLNYSLL